LYSGPYTPTPTPSAPSKSTAPHNLSRSFEEETSEKEEREKREGEKEGAPLFDSRRCGPHSPL